MSPQQLIPAQWEVSPQVVAFSTTRGGGISSAPYASFNMGQHVGDDTADVAENRASLAAALPADLRWQWLNQVHGSDVVRVEEAVAPLTADALLTTRSRVICCVQTADCLPLFVAAIDGSEVAAIHAGWKGLAAGVVENAIAAMCTPVDRLAVWLGPAIGPCHFEVGAEVRECFLAAARSPAAADSLERCFGPAGIEGKYLADLYQIARSKLAALGVRAINGGNLCTYCDAESFFSYRRDGVTGRMLHAIYIDA